MLLTENFFQKINNAFKRRCIFPRKINKYRIDAITFSVIYGYFAYAEARKLARKALQSNRTVEIKWSHVAREIARLDKIQIGMDNATRRLME